MRKDGPSCFRAAGRPVLSLLAAILCGCHVRVPVAHGFVVTHRDGPATPHLAKTSLGMSLVLDRHDSYSPYSTRSYNDRYDPYSGHGGDLYAMDLHRRYDGGGRYYSRDFPASSTLRLQAARDAFYAGLYKDTGRDRYWNDSRSMGRNYLALPSSREGDYSSGYGRGSYDRYSAGGYGGSYDRYNSYDRYSTGGYGSYDRNNGRGYGGSYDRYNTGGYGGSYDRYSMAGQGGSYDRYHSRNDYNRPSSYFSTDRRYGNSDSYGYGAGNDRHRSVPYDSGSGDYRSSNYDRQDYRYGNGRDYRSSSYDRNNNYNVGYGERKTEFYSSRPSYTPSPYDSTTPYDRSNLNNGRRSGDWLSSRADDERHWSSDKPLKRNPYYLSSGGYDANNYEHSRDGRYNSNSNTYDYRSSTGGDRHSRRGNKSRASVSREEEQNFEYVNRERRKHGLQELQWSEDLAREAQRWARHLSLAGELSHRKPLSQGLDEGWRTVTENVAYNPSAGPEGAHASFMQSPGHRKNILDPDVNRMGIGVAKAYYPGSDKYRAGDLYYVVQIFKQV